jgi:cytochrome c oxidase cbb3-type subunit IV
MDLNTIRTVGTVVALAMFLGILWWAYSARRKDAFDEAANLPFADDTAEERYIEAGDPARKGQRQ